MAPGAILIIDDDALSQSGVTSMLSTVFDSITVYGCASLHEMLAVGEVVPTVVFLDIQLPQIGGLAGTGLLQQRWPDAKIVIVSALDLPDTVGAALTQGACASLSTTDRPDRMMTVLREVLDQPPGDQLVGVLVYPSLTPQQADVLTLVGPGWLSNKMIGRRLGLSDHTVRGHVQSLLAVLDVARRSAAVFKAQQVGLIR